jgi:hypothetical protein
VHPPRTRACSRANPGGAHARATHKQPPPVGLEPTTTKRRPLERTLPQSAYRSAVAFASSYASPPFCLPASRCQSSFVLPRAFLIAQARSFDLSLIRGSLCTLRYHPSTLMGDYFERSALDHSATTFRHHGRALGDHWATMGRPLGNLWATIGRLPGTLTSVLLTTTGGFFTRVKKVVTSGSSTTTHARTRARFAIAFRSSLVRFSFSFSVGRARVGVRCTRAPFGARVGHPAPPLLPPAHPLCANSTFGRGPAQSQRHYAPSKRLGGMWVARATGTDTSASWPPRAPRPPGIEPWWSPSGRGKSHFRLLWK